MAKSIEDFREPDRSPFLHRRPLKFAEMFALYPIKQPFPFLKIPHGDHVRGIGATGKVLLFQGWRHLHAIRDGDPEFIAVKAGFVHRAGVVEAVQPKAWMLFPLFFRTDEIRNHFARPVFGIVPHEVRRSDSRSFRSTRIWRRRCISSGR